MKLTLKKDWTGGHISASATNTIHLKNPASEEEFTIPLSGNVQALQELLEHWHKRKRNKQGSNINLSGSDMSHEKQPQGMNNNRNLNDSTGKETEQGSSQQQLHPSYSGEVF